MTAARTVPRVPPNAKCIGGVWLPETEIQFERMLAGPAKPWKRRTINGKVAHRYDKIEAALALRPPERRRLAIDVGAHVGTWAMWIAPHFKRLWAFEPNPAVAELFAWNVAAPAKWRLYSVALGDRHTKAKLLIDRTATGRTHFSHPRLPVSDRLIESQVFQLDGYDLDAPLDLIKIDVEGMEAAVLRGGEQTIRRHRPAVVVEDIGNEKRYGEPRGSAVDLLKSWGAVERRRIKGDVFMSWE